MDSYVRSILTIIAISLSVIALENIGTITSAGHAQIEPQKAQICDALGNCAEMFRCSQYGFCLGVHNG
jgi:hypothetical protein